MTDPTKRERAAFGILASIGRWVAVPIVVVLVGCALGPASDVPAGFAEWFGSRATFTVQPPPAGQTGLDLAADMAALPEGDPGGDPMFDGRVVPVFGVLDCHGDRNCTPVSRGGFEGSARALWVLVYPDCTDSRGTDVGWVAVDALEGVSGGYFRHIPCRRNPP